MARAITRANAYLAQHGIFVKDVGTVAELTPTSMSLIAAGRWKASTNLGKAVYKVAQLKGHSADEAANLRDTYLSLCDEAWSERHGTAVVR